MRPRGTASRKPAKPQHRKPTRPKRRNAAIVASQGSSSQLADLQEQLKHQASELEEARDERAAFAEVLQVIGSSLGELELVFQAILANAMRICEAKFGVMHGYAEGAFRGLSWLSISPKLAEFAQQPAFGDPRQLLVS